MKSLFDVARNGDEFTFESSGINWIWYLKVRVVWPYGRMRVEILKHWRIHKEEENHPETVGTYDILENTRRQACAVSLWFSEPQIRETCAVENVDNVFSYRAG